MEVNWFTARMPPRRSFVGQLTPHNGAYSTHSYNNRDFTTEVAHRKSDDSPIDSFSYTYDSVGNPTALTENNGGSVSFSYDNFYQLTADTRTGNNAYNITYEYDAVGNRSRMVKDGNTTNYTYDNMNRMTAAGSATFSYDANGNTTSKTEGSDTTTYEYDYENRMTRIVYPGGGTTETFAYNGDGVRLSRTDSSGTTRFFWKQGPVSYAQGIGMDDLAFEADGSNQMTAAYHYGNGLVGMTRGTSNYWYHSDNLGTTRLVTDSSQATAASYVYDAFGNIRSQTGSLTNPYEYVGKLGYFTDPGPSALLFLRARYYAPGYGRFISPDQWSTAGERYGYASNAPCVMVDPSGLGFGCAGPGYKRLHLWIYYESLLEDWAGGLPALEQLSQAMTAYTDWQNATPKARTATWVNYGGLDFDPDRVTMIPVPVTKPNAEEVRRIYGAHFHAVRETACVLPVYIKFDFEPKAKYMSQLLEADVYAHYGPWESGGLITFLPEQYQQDFSGKDPIVIGNILTHEMADALGGKHQKGEPYTIWHSGKISEHWDVWTNAAPPFTYFGRFQGVRAQLDYPTYRPAKRKVKANTLQPPQPWENPSLSHECDTVDVDYYPEGVSQGKPWSY
jgi:RHS repeat-associated protein